MQKDSSGEYIFSATDLLNFLECRHLSFLDHKNLTEKMVKTEASAVNKLLQEKGFLHEANFIRTCDVEGKVLQKIPKKLTLKERARLTIEALKSGADVIYQGVLYQGCWRGDVDFLIKTNIPSCLGDYSYEVLDTKLAKNPKPSHVMQLCVYSNLLEEAQDVRPLQMHLVMGDEKEVSFKVNDFAFYFLQAKLRFESFMSNVPNFSYPEPCQHCDYCHWLDRCTSQWETDNHLSLVANIQRSQIDKLEKFGLKTVKQLAASASDLSVTELNPAVLKRLQSQALLQTHKHETGQDKLEVILAGPGCGFARMPLPDSGDLFFDMEGDPLFPNGLEYLFGVYYIKDGEPSFKPFWAHDHDEERETLKQFMNFLDDHLKQFPNAYIYHYNHYETTALKRLVCRYGIFEEQMDNLLRKQKFVDLYKVVRESIRTSEPSYSLKNLETFYMEKRTGDVSTATESIVVYNRWREIRDKKLLQEIMAYNEIDCISTLKLRDWLLTLRSADLPWFTGEIKIEEEENTTNRKQWEIEYEDYQKRLLENVSHDDKQLGQLICYLLEFHNREAKPQWWASFERRDKFEDELIDDPECIGGLRLVGTPVPEKRSLIYTYKFPPQDFKICCYDKVVNVETVKTVGTIVYLNEDECVLKIKRGAKDVLPEQLSIGPPNPVGYQTLRKAIYRVADSVIHQQNKYAAVLDVLNKSIPRIKNKNPGKPIINSNDFFNDALQNILNLSDSYIFIQGPPGSGKTFTSAHLIIELIKQGKKVGVAANSHKAIHNLLAKIEEVALEKQFNFQGIKWGSKDDAETNYSGKFIKTETKDKNICLNESLVAGTAWLFSDERLDGHLDYLFIDEAGQVSIANVVAMGTSTKNLVLVGDQMQLSQPVKGIHPGEAGKSILEYLLGEQATVAPDKGIFLSNTWRLHPKICEFVSAAFYDGRLKSVRETKKEYLLFDNAIAGINPEGIHIIVTDHVGCSQKSEEEGSIIKKYYDQLVLQKISDIDVIRNLTQDDILVVTPYNLQVNYLRSILPPEAKVGTVDKFQGQEAPIVLISMVTSSKEDMPRNIEFLYSKNRLNVALSRAKCLAIIVVNRDLLDIACKSINQMKLVNTFCWLNYYVDQKKNINV